MACAQFPVWFVEFLRACFGKLLPSPKEAIADPRPKHLLFVWWSSPVTMSVKEAVANRHGDGMC